MHELYEVEIEVRVGAQTIVLTETVEAKSKADAEDYAEQGIRDNISIVAVATEFEDD
jgi:hypothetical protein